ncbi:hypothetical protein V1477_004462 [Vespula maculifrons]|uniref:Uncharacterized protein n=1 Tax=Vespula maculifrons TaxID=7453 RepID=A0ABD2CRP3_VESMC
MPTRVLVARFDDIVIVKLRIKKMKSNKMSHYLKQLRGDIIENWRATEEVMEDKRGEKIHDLRL